MVGNLWPDAVVWTKSELRGEREIFILLNRKYLRGHASCLPYATLKPLGASLSVRRIGQQLFTSNNVCSSVVELNPLISENNMIYDNMPHPCSPCTSRLAFKGRVTSTKTTLFTPTHSSVLLYGGMYSGRVFRNNDCRREWRVGQSSVSGGERAWYQRPRSSMSSYFSSTWTDIKYNYHLLLHLTFDRSSASSNNYRVIP